MREVSDLIKKIEKFLNENPYSEVTITRSDKKIICLTNKKDMIKVQLENKI